MFNIIPNWGLNHLNTIGLLFNFIGTILIALFITQDKKEWIENEEGQKPGERWYAVCVKHPKWFIIGIIFFDSRLFL